MDETMLTLKPGVTLTEAGNRVGLTQNGQTQFAKNTRQAEILRALVLHSRSSEGLTALLRTGEGLQSDNENSLAIAEFILDFGEFLEA
ncbi:MULTISPECIES: hypothetical protein [unclassified Oscillibacter]|uniref:hypothetical protein n=1 Tax=unclassified Oscillibacter TaxID=2629304 RepID=UPI0025FC683C|nr:MULTISPECIES: hypothetical protein [unclassified Oscillibacter]